MYGEGVTNITTATMMLITIMAIIHPARARAAADGQMLETHEESVERLRQPLVSHLGADQLEYRHGARMENRLREKKYAEGSLISAHAYQ